MVMVVRTLLITSSVSFTYSSSAAWASGVAGGKRGDRMAVARAVMVACRRLRMVDVEVGVGVGVGGVEVVEMAVMSLVLVAVGEWRLRLEAGVIKVEEAMSND
ncbi:hypothetical protein vseg_010103 [Gypsophila vaccaria]